MTRKVKCPTCGKAVEWSEKNPWRPFCSERCKLIDLGEWASEGRCIPGPPHRPLDEEDEESGFN
jgi:hypothetical protein